jgi:transcription antitermination factor NusG
MLMAVDITKHLEQMLGEPVAKPEFPLPASIDWCMILAQPGSERIGRDSLRRRGVAAWWPNFQREVLRKDPLTGKRYKRTILVPVLPGVILSPWRPSELFWKALDLSPGVNNVMRKFNTEVVMLTEIDVVLIHKIEQGLNKSAPPKGNHSYVVGDTVRMIDDDLRRFGSGRVAECHRDGKLRVDIDIFGRTTPCILASWQVEAVDGGKQNQTGSRSTDARGRPAKSPRRH